MTKVIVPPEWKQVEQAAQGGGTVVVVGASDAGKSTLARWLYRRLCARHVCTAYLDADVGQSTLGLPTSLTVALSSGPGDDRYPPQGVRAGYFVGSITPRGHFLPMVVGVYRLREWAVAHGAAAVVVDTTGLVDPAQGGAALKQWKIELLRPAAVIGLGGSELAPTLEPLSRDGRTAVVALRPAAQVRPRDREARVTRRRARWAIYFRGAGLRCFALAKTPIYEAEGLSAGRLVGLQDAAGLLLGLGVVEGWDHPGGMLVLRTPLPESEPVSSLRVGAIKLDPAAGVESW